MGVNKTAKGEKPGPEMTWVDNKKTNAMIPPLWIIKCLRIFGPAENMLSLLEKSMNQWLVELTSGGTTLGSVSVGEECSRETARHRC